jgi:hypothetical protein
MSTTARLGLPHLSPGQSQKELFHNEALETLDAVVAGAVEEGPRSAPPSSPAVGATYIVGPSASGAWAGQEGKLAAFSSGGWRFIAPWAGLTVFIRSDAVFGVYRAGAWEIGQLRGSAVLVGGQQVVASRRPAIASPAGGTTVDTEGRAAVGQILAALRQHGLIEP